MRSKLFTLAAAVSLVAHLAGCRCSNPSMSQLQEWVSEEIPSGSSEADVRAFCRRHEFNYAPRHPAAGDAIRSIPGCKWVQWDLFVVVMYDDSGLVRSTNVGAENLLP